MESQIARGRPSSPGVCVHSCHKPLCVWTGLDDAGGKVGYGVAETVLGPRITFLLRAKRIETFACTVRIYHMSPTPLLVAPSVPHYALSS